MESESITVTIESLERNPYKSRTLGMARVAIDANGVVIRTLVNVLDNSGASPKLAGPCVRWNQEWIRVTNLPPELWRAVEHEVLAAWQDGEPWTR